MPVQRIRSESEHMRCLCSGFEATLKQKPANAMPVHSFDAKVSICDAGAADWCEVCGKGKALGDW